MAPLPGAHSTQWGVLRRRHEGVCRSRLGAVHSLMFNLRACVTISRAIAWVISSLRIKAMSLRTTLALPQGGLGHRPEPVEDGRKTPLWPTLHSILSFRTRVRLRLSCACVPWAIRRAAIVHPVDLRKYRGPSPRP